MLVNVLSIYSTVQSQKSTSLFPSIFSFFIKSRPHIHIFYIIPYHININYTLPLGAEAGVGVEESTMVVTEEAQAAFWGCGISVLSAGVHTSPPAAVAEAEMEASGKRGVAFSEVETIVMDLLPHCTPQNTCTC